MQLQATIAEKNMHAELKADEFDPTPDAPSASEDAVFPPSAHSLLAVLLPANPPPVPKNARVIRLFDIEAAKFDPRPGEPAAPATAPASAGGPAAVPKKENSRSALREERSKSLFAAARYF
jgi:hypothetical protein